MFTKILVRWEGRKAFSAACFSFHEEMMSSSDKTSANATSTLLSLFRSIASEEVASCFCHNYSLAVATTSFSSKDADCPAMRRVGFGL